MSLLAAPVNMGEIVSKSDDRSAHWEHVYATKPHTAVSWYQDEAEPSLRLIKSTGVRPSAAIIDVGGGASCLVDSLLSKGFSDITVLDVSNAALEIARRRSARRAGRLQHVEWLVADATQWNPQPQRFDLWHDRAVFHFLVEASARAAYIGRLRTALKPGSFVVIGAFALNGPQKCSGLPVMRHDSESLARELGDQFRLLSDQSHVHRTPSGAEQRFHFAVFQNISKAE